MTSNALPKQDWWKLNAFLQFALGTYSLIVRLAYDVSEAGITVLFGSLIEYLVGLALWRHSRLVFWILFVLYIFGFTLNLIGIARNNSLFNPIAFAIYVTRVAFILMLFQQIRNEKKGVTTLKAKR